MDPLSNPYRPGAGTEPPALTGRDSQLGAFTITLQRALQGRPGKSLMPIGLRGVGKTVLLNRFEEKARQARMHVATIEAPDDGTFLQRLAPELRRVVLDLNRGPVSQAVGKALGVLRSFSVSYKLPGEGGTISLGVEPLAGYGDSGNLTHDLTDLVVALGEAARDREAGVLIAIDELQYLGRAELAGLITAIHRTTQLNLPLVLVAAGLPQVPALAGEARSYAERLFNFPEIGSLERQDAYGALQIPAEELGVRFSPDALAAVMDQTQGYPYFLQEWGYHLWNWAAETPISIADVESVASSVQKQLDQNFFRVRFDRLTPRERDYLRAMAELGPGPHRSGTIADTLGVRVESAGPLRSGLISKGMVFSPAHGDTAFTVPMFDRFLLRSMPGWTSPRRRSQS